MVKSTVPFFTSVAVLVVPISQEARHARDQVGGVDRGGIAGRLEIAA